MRREWDEMAHCCLDVVEALRLKDEKVVLSQCFQWSQQLMEQLEFHGHEQGCSQVSGRLSLARSGHCHPLEEEKAFFDSYVIYRFQLAEH